MTKCRFTSQYWNYERHAEVNFYCDVEALDSGLCIFHDDKYHLDNPDKTIEHLNDKVQIAVSSNKPLVCIGYHIPPSFRLVSIKFKKPIYFSKAHFHGDVDFHQVEAKETITINTGGDAFEIQASKVSEESQYAKIVQLVRKAQEEKAPIQRLADRYALWFTPITLAISGLGWLITQNPQTILSVLVVATPCSLIFATPVAIMSGINRSAKIGIIIKSGAAIEKIGKAEAVVFDKTGTITYTLLIANTYRT